MPKTGKAMRTNGPAEREMHNWALFAGYVPESVLKAYEAEREAIISKAQPGGGV